MSILPLSSVITRSQTFLLLHVWGQHSLFLACFPIVCHRLSFPISEVSEWRSTYSQFIFLVETGGRKTTIELYNKFWVTCNRCGPSFIHVSKKIKVLPAAERARCHCTEWSIGSIGKPSPYSAFWPWVQCDICLNFLLPFPGNKNKPACLKSLWQIFCHGNETAISTPVFHDFYPCSFTG